MNWPPLSNETSACLQAVIAEAVIKKPKGEHALIQFVMEQLQKKSGWDPEKYDQHLAQMIEKIPRDYVLEELCPEESDPFRWIPMRYNDDTIRGIVKERAKVLCKKMLNDPRNLDTASLHRLVCGAYPEFGYLRDTPSQSDAFLLIKALSLGASWPASDTQLLESGSLLEGKKWNVEGCKWLHSIIQSVVLNDAELNLVLIVLLLTLARPYKPHILAWPTLDLLNCEGTKKFVEAVSGIDENLFNRLCCGEASVEEYKALHSLPLAPKPNDRLSGMEVFLVLAAMKEVVKGSPNETAKAFVSVALEYRNLEMYTTYVDSLYPAYFKNQSSEWKRMAHRLMIIGGLPSAEKLDSALALTGNVHNLQKIVGNMHISFLRFGDFLRNVQNRCDATLAQCFTALDKLFAERSTLTNVVIDFRELAELTKPSAVLVTPIDQMAFTFSEEMERSYVIMVNADE